MRSGAGYKLARQAAFVELDDRRGAHGLRAVLVRQRLARPRLGRQRSATTPSPRRWWARTRTGSSTCGTRSTTARSCACTGRASVGVAILSAIDIALWDLKGKALGAPVYQLLGGAFQDPVPAYSSSVYWSTPEHAVEQAQAFLDQGFKAFKVKVGLDVDNDIASLRAIREARRPRRRHPGRRQPVLHAPPGAAGRPRAGGARHRASSRSRCRSPTSPATRTWPRSSTSASRRARTCTRAGTSCRSSRPARSTWCRPTRPAAAASARRSGSSTSRARINLHAIPHTFSDALTIAANLHLVAASANSPIIEYDAHVQPDPDGARHEPAAARRQRHRAADRPGPRRRHRLGLRRRPPVHGRDRHRRRLAPRCSASHIEVIPDRTATLAPSRVIGGVDQARRRARARRARGARGARARPGRGAARGARGRHLRHRPAHRGRRVRAAAPPVTMGHEVCGVVAAVGEGVDEALVGARVVSRDVLLAPAARAAAAATGAPNLCPERRSIGSFADGGVRARGWWCRPTGSTACRTGSTTTRRR